MFPFTKKLTTDNTDNKHKGVDIKCAELEAGLRESEEKFRKITESAQDAIIMMGADRRVSFWNTAAEHIFGYTATEALGQEMHTLIVPPQAHDAFKQGFQHFRESGEGLVIGKVLEVTALRKGGEEFPAELSISAAQIGGQWHAIGIIRDITERKREENTLHDSHESLDRLLNSMNEGAYGTDAMGNCTFANRAFLQILGYQNSDEALGKNIHELIHHSHPDGTPYSKDECKISQAYQNNQSINVSDEVFWRQDGIAIPVEYWSRPIENNGVVVGAIITFIDITVRKQAEFLLRESEEKFRGIFESALDGILLADAKTKRFVISNPIICHMLGYTPDEIIQLGVQDIHPAQDLPHIVEQFEKQLRGKIELATDIPVKRKDGSIFYADIKSSPVHFGGKTYLVGVFRDITERKNMEDAMVAHEAALKRLNQSLEVEKEAVRNEKAKDEALLASIGEGMFATDEEGKIITINRAAEHMLGLKLSEVVGKKMVEAIPAIDENSESIPPDKRVVSIALATGHKTTTGTTSYIRKNGSPIPVAITISPVILDKKLIGTIGIFRDITKEKELEETRRDLLSLASHQLRTPLSGTKWLIETLIKGIHGPLTKEQKEYLDEIYKINERMTTLVHDMLSVLRMESGITATKKEQVSMRSLVNTIFDGLDAVAKNKHITLRLTEGEDHTIDTDPLLLQNVLEGLLSNSINYSSPGSEAVVSIERNLTELLFSVRDSGIGIPKEEQGQIFSRFYRASNAKTFDTRGTGLGLYIASMLAKKIGASISFESEPGKGSTFFVHIPLSPAEPLLENVGSV